MGMSILSFGNVDTLVLGVLRVDSGVAHFPFTPSMPHLRNLSFDSKRVILLSLFPLLRSRRNDSSAQAQVKKLPP